MSKKSTDTSKTSEEMKTTSNQIKQQFINFTKSSKRKLHALDIKNKLKLNKINNKFKDTKYNPATYNPATYESPLTANAKPSDLCLLNRVTTIFSGVVIVGLSAGLLWMAKPEITEDTFSTKMQDSISAAFAYEGNEVNTKNGTIAYHIPRQFQYRWSIGVNDIIKYKDNEVIMHYNNQYNVIGEDTDTYYLLRDENKAAGEEVFYKNFNMDGQNGFVQLVKMTEKYLLTVFVDGTKLSAIIDYEEAPYLAYNMLVVGRTVEVYEPLSVGTQLTKKEADLNAQPSTHSEETTSQTNISQANSIDDSKPTPTTDDESSTGRSAATDDEAVSEGQLSTSENEQVIEFDFSSEKRSEIVPDEGAESN